MGIEDISVRVMFEMGRRMSEVRGNNPKYIVREEPRIGSSLEVFEYMPTGEDIKEGRYVAAGSIVPREITRESDESNWYLVRDKSSQFIVHQNQTN